MRVAMTGFAKQQICETATYIQKKFGKKYRDNFIKKVRATSLLLADNPNLGSIEPLLSDLPTTYRSVVVTKLNKMVYRILDDCIEVADIWDTRREPSTLANQVK